MKIKIKIKILLIINISLFFTVACQKTALSYEKIFEAPLGFEINEIGSNLPILESYTNRQGFPNSLLTDVPSFTIHNQKVYIADSYNKRVSVFPLSKDSISPQPFLTIPNQGENYSFARPYEVFVDRYNDIYVLASIQDFESYEIQNYSNQTAEIDHYDQFQKDLKKIPPNNFYLYKFSSQGIFLYQLGINGANSSPLTYPEKIQGDNFGNVYLTFPIFTEEQNSLIVRRYAPTGELNFEFNSKTINIHTNINNIYYQGNILSIDNYKHDEQLAILTEYQPITNQNGEIVPALIDNIWFSVNIYSILENDFTTEIFKNTSITESILGIDEIGNIFFQSFDIEEDSLKIRVLSTEDLSEKIYYTPVYSSYYLLFEYFIDNKGNLYSYLLDRNRKIMILKWNTEES